MIVEHGKITLEKVTEETSIPPRVVKIDGEIYDVAIYPLNYGKNGNSREYNLLMDTLKEIASLSNIKDLEGSKFSLNLIIEDK